MSVAVPQPNAAPLPDSLVAELLTGIYGDDPPASPETVHFHGAHSNDVVEIRLTNGRTLMVKRGRHPWTAERFRTSRAASNLLRERSDVIVPAPLDLPGREDGEAVEAYWRIQLPTLEELWPDLSPEERAEALRSWGSMARRVHDVALLGHGSLRTATTEPRSLADHLTADLEDRLLPAVVHTWPAGVDSLVDLVATIPTLAGRCAAGGVLVHNDLHMGNVLCEITDGRVRCVGLLDLETAVAAPPEADLAIAQVQHGATSVQPLHEGWFASLLQGYGAEPDPFVLAFFRGYHLANLGFYAALVGHAEHAARVAAALAEEVSFLREGAV